MFFTYLAREVVTRKRQTLVVVSGLALAIALVIVVNAMASAVQSAQKSVLESVYGVGTDITVSATAAPGSGGPGRFEFDADSGSASSDGESRTISRSRLRTAPGTGELNSTQVKTVAATANVAATSAALSLENTTFDGELPEFTQNQAQGQAPGEGSAPAAPPTGGADGAGGTAFDVDRFSVVGVGVKSTEVGPLSGTTITDGRAFAATDVKKNVALVDAVYAASNEIAVGDSLDVGDGSVKVVGIVESGSGDGVTTGNDVYVPLSTAQTLSGMTGVVTDIYVKADSAESIDAIEAALTTALPDATVSTQADLAGSVTGSLSTASDLVDKAGRWLSLGALTAAFLLAILFTVSGVGRRTREFGTLKAIGWRNRRVVGQVAGETVFQGLLGGAVGVALGVIAVQVLNAMNLTLSGSATTATGPVGAGPGSGGGFPPGGPGAAAQAVDIALTASISIGVIAGAIGLALLGGLLAGAFGGRRAARLSPAEALRTVS